MGSGIELLSDAGGDPPQTSTTAGLLDFLKGYLNSPQDACVRNPIYDELLQVTMRNIYDPSVLGNRDEFLNRYSCDVKSTEDAYKYAEQAVASLGDPFTEILDPDKLKALTQKVDGGFSGIGISIQSSPDDQAKGPLTVQRVFDGGPAQKAGLRYGDVITKVNGLDLNEFKQVDALDLIRGKTGTDVLLTVTRDGKEMPFKITRAQVKAPVVEEKMLDGNVAYISLSTFLQDDASDQVKAALLKNKDAKAYILDLRFNPGGSVNNALKIASLFVGDGTLVSTRSRLESDPAHPVWITEDYNVSSKATDGTVTITATDGRTGRQTFKKEKDIVDKPVVILVNEYSASASEMAAAAIRDNGAAIVVGSQTFGKGVAQEIIPTGAAAVKVTSTRYYSPHKDWFGDGNKERIGLTPDIVVANPEKAMPLSPEDAQLKRALELLRNKQYSDDVRKRHSQFSVDPESYVGW